MDCDRIGLRDAQRKRLGVGRPQVGIAARERERVGVVHDVLQLPDASGLLVEVLHASRRLRWFANVPESVIEGSTLSNERSIVCVPGNRLLRPQRRALGRDRREQLPRALRAQHRQRAVLLRVAVLVAVRERGCRQRVRPGQRVELPRARVGGAAGDRGVVDDLRLQTRPQRLGVGDAGGQRIGARLRARALVERVARVRPAPSVKSVERTLAAVAVAQVVARVQVADTLRPVLAKRCRSVSREDRLLPSTISRLAAARCAERRARERGIERIARGVRVAALEVEPRRQDDRVERVRRPLDAPVEALVAVASRGFRAVWP